MANEASLRVNGGSKIMGKKALIVGATGIVGTSLAERLISNDWEVAGLSRRPSGEIKGLVPVAADLLEPSGLRGALENLRPSHVFFATWSRHPTEAENIRVNGAMIAQPARGAASEG